MILAELLTMTLNEVLDCAAEMPTRERFDLFTMRVARATVASTAIERCV